MMSSPQLSLRSLRRSSPMVYSIQNSVTRESCRVKVKIFGPLGVPDCFMSRTCICPLSIYLSWMVFASGNWVASQRRTMGK